MAATTGRAVVPAAVVVGGAENPSAAPVLTFSSLPESRVRERWTVGVAAARPASRFGPMFRMRAGAGGAVLPGAGVPVSVPALVRGRSPSTARCTGEVWAGARAGAERTGISDGVPGVLGVFGAVGGVVACGGVVCGDGVPVGPGRIRRRSPRSGASRWTRAVDGSEVRGVPMPPRVRARGPAGASAGCVRPGEPSRGA
ncbi:hypothetical protein [Streptomyces sp. bgisy029]|uniref:hypothetical protein n=1 Tax=Streptomyces sp. bgisy029 TaxID=3413771 RepID=UPI003D735D9B